MLEIGIQSVTVLALQEAGLGLPTAYPGFAFEPPDDAPWARLSFLPVSRDSKLQTVDKVRFIAQVDLNYPPGKGAREIGIASQTVRQHFQPKRRFSDGTQGITVHSCADATLRDQDAGWQRATLSITFDAVVEREAAIPALS